ncbi:penicillin-binding protein 1A [Thiomonas sp. FB-Cd]|uniref:penicillin-binding protein 1A n=1 Tax=Thiomonas sp. FB-Cd TaxID=1158292 RepID=UPI001E62EFEF|nr:PBP1A family penicillin-binding protein [Thiomonas sp. FB-Cd]
MAFAWPRLPDVQQLVDYRPKLPLRVYSADHVLLGEFGEERRDFVPIARMPQVMKLAVLATEDDRFYQHSGIDWRGLARAAVANLNRAKSQGASTITMQVARNFYLSSEKTFTRKLFEVLLALKIERELSKAQILELYMNQIYLGQHAYGFSAAAQTYFGKPLSQISLAQAAMLAGLPKAPSASNPFVNLPRAKIRQQYVLGRMRALGWISDTEYAQAKAAPLGLRVESPDRITHAHYIAEMVRQAMFARFGEQAYTRGLSVTTTIISRDQQAAWQALHTGVMHYELRQVWRGPEAYVDPPADGAGWPQTVDDACDDHPDTDGLQCAVVTAVSPRQVQVMRPGGAVLDLSGDSLRQAAALGLGAGAQPNVALRPGAVVHLWKPQQGHWVITQIPRVQSAFVAMNPENGAIQALVGGFDFQQNAFNHVTQAQRQPGSSFKPFIYSAALHKGFMPPTLVNDAPLFFDAAATGGQAWEPKNYDGTYDGPITLKRGMAQSKNMVAIRVLNAIGPKYAQQWSARFGFDPATQPPYLTLALGAGTATPLQMVRAYSVFANGGYLVQPYLIASIADGSGKALASPEPQRAGDERLRTITPRNAFVMNTLLQEVTRTGTAARAQAELKRPDLYGKTGTTNDAVDAWFCGYNPRLAAVAWVGYDTPLKLGARETGGRVALPIWIDFMRTALRGVPVTAYRPPPGVVQMGDAYVYEEFAAGAGIHALDVPTPPPAAPASGGAASKLFPNWN